MEPRSLWVAGPSRSAPNCTQGQLQAGYKNKGNKNPSLHPPLQFIWQCVAFALAWVALPSGVWAYVALALGAFRV